MGRRRKAWLLTEQPKPIDGSKMIEHSITKHVAPKPQAAPIIALPSNRYYHHMGNAMNTWVKPRCENYINDLRNRGFKEGAKIVSKWGITGSIEGFKPIPEEGWSFSGTIPCCLIIRREFGVQNTIFYSEEELTVTGEQ